MLQKCTNPSCSATFRYLDEGKLFRVEYNSELQTSVRVQPQYFWLCPQCSERMTLRLDRDTTVRTIVCLDRIRHGTKDLDFVPLEKREGLLLSCFRSVARQKSNSWQGLANSLAWTG